MESGGITRLVIMLIGCCFDTNVLSFYRRGSGQGVAETQGR